MRLTDEGTSILLIDVRDRSVTSIRASSPLPLLTMAWQRDGVRGG